QVDDNILNIDVPPTGNIYSYFRHLNLRGNLNCQFVKFNDFFVKYFFGKHLSSLSQSSLTVCF
ncbi:MAG: hypothetical protein ABSH06_30015, partial [Thermodesulfobacteriota bacterium]